MNLQKNKSIHDIHFFEYKTTFLTNLKAYNYSKYMM